VARHTWFLQTLEEQTLPQWPQFVRSVLPFVSHPSRLVFSSALQLRNPAEQLTIEQIAPEQIGVPFWVPHACPHPPQWLGLD
jgi:hypothetical protein